MLEWVPLAEWRALPAVSGIYVIRHQESGKEYVGLSSDIRRRLGAHTRSRRSNSLLARAIRKYGIEAFFAQVLCYATVQMLPKLEVFWVAERNTLRPAGYNLTLGGEGTWGRSHTEAAKELMRQARLGKPLSAKHIESLVAASKLSVPNRSDEVKARMLAGARKPKPESHRKAVTDRNKNMSEHQRAAVGKINKGKTGSLNHLSLPVGLWLPGSMTPMTFGSTTEAAAWLGCFPSRISQYCRGINQQRDGSAWAYL